MSDLECRKNPTCWERFSVIWPIGLWARPRPLSID